MKFKTFFLAALACGSLAFQACNGTEAKDKPQQNNADAEFSKALGTLIGQNLKQSGISNSSLDATAFSQALEASLNGQDLMDINEANQLVQSRMMDIQKQKAEADKAKFAGNREAGEKFLAENGKKKGVVTTASGLQYEVLKEGNGGKKPSLQNKVKVHYHGTLIDGKVFDSSVERGEPISFPLGGVIQGWQEGVQLMTVGSKFRFTIPFNLAYGENGAGANIPPFSTLIFDVELLEIQ